MVQASDGVVELHFAFAYGSGFHTLQERDTVQMSVWFGHRIRPGASIWRRHCHGSGVACASDLTQAPGILSILITEAILSLWFYRTSADCTKRTSES